MFDIPSTEGLGGTEALEGMETRSLEEMTFEPASYLEGRGEFQQAEALQVSLEAVIARLAGEEAPNTFEKVSDIPLPLPSPAEEVSTLPVPLPSPAEEVSDLPGPMPSPTEGVSSLPEPIPGPTEEVSDLAGSGGEGSLFDDILDERLSSTSNTDAERQLALQQAHEKKGQVEKMVSNVVKSWNQMTRDIIANLKA